jgi:hypothetical protein
MRYALSRLLLVSVLTACGGGGEAKPDARIVVVDAPVINPPDAAPLSPDATDYDFSCTNTTAPTTAPAMIAIGGTTQQLSMNGPQPLASVTIDTFAMGTPDRLSRVTSDMSGMFSMNVTTGGVPLDGYVKGVAPMYRTTYVFPDAPFAAAQASAPVLMISSANFGVLASQLASVTQNDTTNGALFIVVTDCANKPIDGVTLSVKKDGVEVGSQFDLGALAAQAAGSLFVFNVPDGDVQISGSFDNHTLRSHTIKSVKGVAAQPGDPLTGSITTSVLRPGF